MSHQDETDEMSTNHMPPGDQLRCSYMELLEQITAEHQSTSKVYPTAWLKAKGIITQNKTDTVLNKSSV